MAVSNQIRGLNVALRAATLVSRFLFIFFLARLLEPAQVGLYGLVTAAIGYSLYLLGFDFYTYTTREVLKHERHEWGGLLKNQGALSLVLYAIFIPTLCLIFIKGLLPWRLVGWFFALLILEHLNQELSRLLIAISQQLLTSILLFVRQGTWAIAITALMAVEPSTRSLDYVFGAWTVAGVVAVGVGVFKIAQLEFGDWHKSIDWRWILKGLKISIPFLVATLAIRGIFTLDRYWLQSLGGLEIVGAYVLFMGIGGTLMAFLDASVFAFSYPGLIGAYQKKQPELFRKNLRFLTIQTVVISLVFVVVSLLLLPPLLNLLANPLYARQQYLYPWILAAMVLYSLGMIPHFGLYSQGMDRPIIYSHITSLVAFAISTWLFSQRWPLLAVPFGLCAALGLTLVIKIWCFWRFTPFQYRSTKSCPLKNEIESV